MLSTPQIVLLCVLICFEGAHNTHIRKKIEHRHELFKQKESIEKPEEIKIGEEIKQDEEIKSIEIGPKHLHHWKHQGLLEKEEEVKIGEEIKKYEEIKPIEILPINEYLSKLKGFIGRKEEVKQHGRHVLPREAPEEPAPVEEKLADDIDFNAGLPFLEPPPKPVRISLEREVVEKPKGMGLNTDITSSLITIENNVEPSEERELPRRQTQEINSLSELYITPRPIPAGPRPAVTIAPPGNNVRTQVNVSPMSLGPVFANQAQGASSSVQPVPILQPMVTFRPVPLVPAPSPPPSPAPTEETPIIKPRRYVAYLGDMFLKLMTQLLGRARLTLNRLTGSPPTSPELKNNAK